MDIVGCFLFYYFTLHLLASSCLHFTVLLQTDSRDGDESGSFGRREVTDLVHAGLGHVVQLLGFRGAAQDDEVALVRTAADLSVDGLLGSRDGGFKELAFWGEVQTIVQELSDTGLVMPIT